MPCLYAGAAVPSDAIGFIVWVVIRSTLVSLLSLSCTRAQRGLAAGATGIRP